MTDIGELKELARLVRYYILRMTTKAGSGHPTSSLSATDLGVCLFFDKLRFDPKDPDNPNNDRVIFSKGHASSLLYALCGAAGILTEKEIDTYRKFKSPLEGHPVPRFKYVEVATGSLGQGLSIGLGMALAIRQEFTNSKFQTPIVYVLMGDSEFAEGSVWEALEVASYYKLDNLVGIIDVNRLGQSGETMLGWQVEEYKRRVEAFGWEAHVVDGHDFDEICRVFDFIGSGNGRPKMIIAKTIKGKGVPFLEDKEGWHGVALSEDDFKKAVFALGKINKKIKGEISKPIANLKFQISKVEQEIGNKKLETNYKIGELVATRKAYGEALVKLGMVNSDIVCLDAETKNSTFALTFKEKFPERYFEMFIAEQNMVGTALGLSKRDKIPFVSTFAVFLSRAFDQIRMSAYSKPNIKFCGSHCGVSIGMDGPSQMGLEDIAMFRAVFESHILYPADVVACEKLVEIMAESEGLFYLRTNRPATPVIYSNKEAFKIGGSKVVKSSKNDRVTVVACGITLIEAICAAEELAKRGINIRIIDAYSVKPIDEATIQKSAKETNNLVITVEDHYFEGGLGDAVLNVFAYDERVKVYKLAVSKMPVSGKPEELLNYEGISAGSIVSKILGLVK